MTKTLERSDALEEQFDRQKGRQGFSRLSGGNIAFYGPNRSLATKVAVGIVDAEGRDARLLERWLSDDGVDIRFKTTVLRDIDRLLKKNTLRSVVMVDGIIGCPHEEGIDYPDGEECPACPHWHGRDRFTGELIE